ncbi:MAG: UDP-N-acetylglucosamine 4,6-dehydratase (inverting) [Deltaproteobacteria bacterium]|nr:UDP-N-acetylglucosamine 4,6-dehydratase (inverting) [Deltaproteobacteria bacterium]
MNIDGASILVTGGTGSFGRKFTEVVLEHHAPERLVIFSRDELKQWEMSQTFSMEQYPCMRYFIGDVRDKERLARAFEGVDYVIHAAALKQVPAAEYNPLEAIKTNILGAANIIDVAIDKGVKRVIALSTDKAANPINLYGATKLCSDKLFVAGNAYVGERETRFSVVRYGNVIGSRGSVVPFFKKMAKTGRIPVTDPRMTRFWITLEQGVEFVLRCLDVMQGGELFVPKIPSMRITDLAEAIAPGCEHDIVGIRPGEKIHETLIGEDDARHTLETDDMYVIEPEFHWWTREVHVNSGANPVSESFRYTSDSNNEWLSVEQLRELAGTA